MVTEKNAQRLADELLQVEFLQAWPADTIELIPLERYVNVGDKTTFCQYVETVTRPLGSIKGMNSIKFGIYKRRNPSARPKNAFSNSTHSWSTRFNAVSGDEFEVYKTVISEISKIASFAIIGDFGQIQDLHLMSIFKWKVAYLYSSGRLIPIFSIENLRSIVIHLGMEGVDRYTTYWNMQQFLISRKPLGKTSVEFMRLLYDEFRLGYDKPPLPAKRNRKRKASKSKSLVPVNRKGCEAGISNQVHNLLQMKLYNQLCSEYTESCVDMEKDWVDLLVELPEKVILFEIKPFPYAEDCIKAALGQLLLYAFFAIKNYRKTIELVIAGPNGITLEESELLLFLSNRVKFPISYLKIS